MYILLYTNILFHFKHILFSFHLSIIQHIQFINLLLLYIFNHFDMDNILIRYIKCSLLYIHTNYINILLNLYKQNCLLDNFLLNKKISKYFIRYTSYQNHIFIHNSLFHLLLIITNFKY